MAIAFVQGPARGDTPYNGSTISVTMASTPIAGNLLIAVVTVIGPFTVSSISQSGVTWTLQKQSNVNVGWFFGAMDAELWVGVVGANASTLITITLTGSTVLGGVADVCEFSGLLTSGFLDQTASNSGHGYTTIDSGTIPATTQADELWIAGLVGCEFPYNGGTVLSSPTNGFTLLDGVVMTDGFGVCGYAYKIVSSVGTANCSVTQTYGVDWNGIIVTFKAAAVSPPKPKGTITIHAKVR